MLKQRVITALVLSGALLAVLLAAPALVFGICVAVVCTLAAWEWAALAQLSNWGRGLFALSTLAGAGIIYHWLPQGLTLSWAVALLMWAAALVWVSRYPKYTDQWANVPIRGLLGVGALIPTVLAFWFLRHQPLGQWWVVLLLVIVATADSAAYFTGKALGKRKLAPAVSPGKSWEGVLGGWAAAAVLAVVLSLINPDLSLTTCMLLVMPAAMISVLGDLLESMLKREAGVKDSGNLLPGHGGFLDRIDALTAAAPVFALSYVLVAQ